MRLVNRTIRRSKAAKPPKKRAASPSGLKMVPIEVFAPKLRESTNKYVDSLKPIFIDPFSRCLCRNRALDLQPVQLESMRTPSEPQQNIPSLVLDDNSPPNPSHPLSHSHDQSEMPASADAMNSPNAYVSKRKLPPVFVSQLTGLLRLSKKRKTSYGGSGAADADATTPFKTMPMPTSRPSTESKPLKPLAAFMDQFLENLRSISMHAESSVPQQTSKAAVRPSSRRKSSGRARISGAVALLGLTLLGSSESGKFLHLCSYLRLVLTFCRSYNRWLFALTGWGLLF